MCCRDEGGIKFSFSLGAADIPELTHNIKALTRASKEALQALTALKEAQGADAPTASSKAQEASNGRSETSPAAAST